MQAVQVTGESVDPLFNDPYVEVNELRDSPVPHRYVHGGFRETDARFSFYFPPAERYEGRFHHNTYPLATSSDVGPFPIAFDVATGATVSRWPSWVLPSIDQRGSIVAARRRSLAAIIVVRSCAGRISQRPTFTPGCFEISWMA